MFMKGNKTRWVFCRFLILLCPFHQARLRMEIILAWTAKAVDCFDHKYQIIQKFRKGGDPQKKTRHLWGRNDREEMADRGCFLPLHFYNSIQEMVVVPFLW